MKRLLFFLSALLIGWLGAYEVPQGVLSVSELEKVQQKAKESGKPVVLVLAIKTQPET
ncbi:MAG: hypothetical protein ACSHYB_17365 [Roseibacillus sp.]